MNKNGLLIPKSKSTSELTNKSDNNDDDNDNNSLPKVVEVMPPVQSQTGHTYQFVSSAESDIKPRPDPPTPPILVPLKFKRPQKRKVSKRKKKNLESKNSNLEYILTWVILALLIVLYATYMGPTLTVLLNFNNQNHQKPVKYFLKESPYKIEKVEPWNSEYHNLTLAHIICESLKSHAAPLACMSDLNIGPTKPFQLCATSEFCILNPRMTGRSENTRKIPLNDCNLLLEVYDRIVVNWTLLDPNANAEIQMLTIFDDSLAGQIQRRLREFSGEDLCSTV